MQCEGHWRESTLYFQLRTEKKHRKRGSRRWMTVPEMAQKFGSLELAKRIAQAKHDDPEMSQTQMRQNRDLPGCTDMDSQLKLVGRGFGAITIKPFQTIIIVKYSYRRLTSCLDQFCPKLLCVVRSTN